MGIFVAWMRAKAMASGAGVAPKTGGKRSGIVLIEYLILAGAILVTSAALTTAIEAFFNNIAAEFDEATVLVSGLI